MKLVLILVMFGLSSGAARLLQRAESLERGNTAEEGDLKSLLESAYLDQRELETGEGNQSVTDADSIPADDQETGGDLEQFLLHSEELLKIEHDKLETLTVRASSHEEETEALTARINYQQDQIAQILSALKKPVGVKTQSVGVNTLSSSDYGGVSYIRWGRTECEGSAQEIYTGSAASSWWTHTGGGSDYLCLPEKPEWGTVLAGRQVGRSYIAGVEYQIDTPGYPFSSTRNNGQNLNDNDAPCVLCHVPTRSDQIMIPAKLNCPVGWVREYYGYLASSQSSHHRSSYVCVDATPETVPGGEANKDGAVFYPVEGYCVSALPCPRYVDGWEITCVVCTK